MFNMSVASESFLKDCCSLEKLTVCIFLFEIYRLSKEQKQ